MDILGQIAAMKVPLYASQASFFLALSVFPALVLLMSLLRYTELEVADLTELLHGILPNALMPSAQNLIEKTYRSSTGTLLSISAITTLWSASRGMEGLRSGLNAIAGEADTSWLRARLSSILYTVLFLLTLLLTLALHVMGNGLIHYLPHSNNPLLQLLESVVDLRFFLLLVVQIFVFCGMFAYFPNRRSRLRDVFPGAVFAALGWLGFTYLYSIYVEYFTGLSLIYGSVYAVALSLLWLYCCMSIVFYGSALNHWLIRRNSPKAE